MRGGLLDTVILILIGVTLFVVGAAAFVHREVRRIDARIDALAPQCVETP